MKPACWFFLSTVCIFRNKWTEKHEFSTSTTLTFGAARKDLHSTPTMLCAMVSFVTRDDFFTSMASVCLINSSYCLSMSAWIFLPASFSCSQKRVARGGGGWWFVVGCGACAGKMQGCVGKRQRRVGKKSRGVPSATHRTVLSAEAFLVYFVELLYRFKCRIISQLLEALSRHAHFSRTCCCAVDSHARKQPDSQHVARVPLRKVNLCHLLHGSHRQ